MRQPLWAINSSLLFLCILGQLVFFLLYTPVPRRVSLEPDTIHMPEKKIGTVVSIKNIYEQNDLFGTYVPPVAAAPKLVEPVIPIIPEAPANIPLKIPVEPEKVFIAPLAVNLKGVMYSRDKQDHSIAIIQFQDSKEEINYRVGQLINDAQVLKIYPNRVIVVRSNGQQETLYLREDEAGKDLTIETAKDIAGIIITQKNGYYQIPIEKFVAHVKSLGQFIDLLGLTTVYQKGKSVGCRIGNAAKDSLGMKLGFMRDDIIQQIDNLPVTDISSRVLAFDHVLQKKAGDVITTRIDRGGTTLELKYILTKSAQSDVVEATGSKAGAKAPVISEQAVYNLEEERKKLLEQKVKMAPTAHQLEMEERRRMFEARRRDMFANRPTSAAHSKQRFDGTMGQQFGAQKVMNTSTLGAKGAI